MNGQSDEDWPEGACARYELRIWWKCCSCGKVQLAEDDGAPRDACFEILPSVPEGWIYFVGQPMCGDCPKRKSGP